MFDAGWPNSYTPFLQTLKEHKIQLHDIEYLIVSHFHIDHAGLTQKLRDHGIKLILHPSQRIAVKSMNAFFIKKPNKAYFPIIENGIQTITTLESRTLLEQMGIQGEIIATPGHSDDSISLIIDGICAFVGDIPKLELANGYDDKIADAIVKSWGKICSYDVVYIYPAHDKEYSIKKLSAHLASSFY
jgi:glyoxylase-like metal-dependent hydrolase (beta-lactamase superfamily II)